MNLSERIDKIDGMQCELRKLQGTLWEEKMNLLSEVLGRIQAGRLPLEVVTVDVRKLRMLQMKGKL